MDGGRSPWSMAHTLDEHFIIFEALDEHFLWTCLYYFKRFTYMFVEFEMVCEGTRCVHVCTI